MIKEVRLQATFFGYFFIWSLVYDLSKFAYILNSWIEMKLKGITITLELVMVIFHRQ